MKKIHNFDSMTHLHTDQSIRTHQWIKNWNQPIKPRHHIYVEFLVTSVPMVGLCPIMAYARGLPIYGSLHPGTDVTKNLKSIYGHNDPLVALWLMKRIPRSPTTKYAPPPSLKYDSSHSTVPSAWWLKTEGCHPYWYVFTNQKRPTGVYKT